MATIGTIKYFYYLFIGSGRQFILSSIYIFLNGLHTDIKNYKSYFSKVMYRLLYCVTTLKVLTWRLERGLWLKALAPLAED